MESQATPKQQVAEQLKNASSIMVTTGKNPSVDEVASAIGLTHMLQSMNKHATAVISTQLPAVLEFMHPQEMVETTTDRLRDFVITFSKEKADKLRYKVVDEDVKIFITPYKTILSQDDLNFTQGDYNIDTVVVIGATKREELDQAVLEHSRVMSDSTVVTINAGDKSPSVGSINWHDQDASSVAEMLVSMSEALASGLLNKDSSQALLTGLVSATNQFGNTSTTPKVMTMAAQLMAAGADQQQIMNAFEKQKELTVAHQTAQTGEQPKAQLEEQPANNASEEPVVEFTHNDKISQDAPAPQQNTQPTTQPAPAEPYTGDDLVENSKAPNLADVPLEQPQPADNTPRPSQPTSNESLVITEPPKGRIVLDGASSPEPAISPVKRQLPQVETDKRQRIDEPAHADISDNPLMSQPATTNTDQPALNAHDHSGEKSEASEKNNLPILDHRSTPTNNLPKSTPAQRPVDVDMNNGPHIKVNPEAPMLENKPKISTSKQDNSQSNQQATNEDPLAVAREAVEQAADSQPPTLPKPMESINAQDMQTNNDGGIQIDHNGNIQQ